MVWSLMDDLFIFVIHLNFLSKALELELGLDGKFYKSRSSILKKNEIRMNNNNHHFENMNWKTKNYTITNSFFKHKTRQHLLHRNKWLLTDQSKLNLALIIRTQKKSNNTREVYIYMPMTKFTFFHCYKA